AALPPDASVPHPDAALPPDAGTQPPVVMFANNEASLYRINTTTYAPTLVAGFVFPAGIGADAMADLAIAPDGSVLGASSSHLYKINPSTASCTLIGNLSV